MRPARAVFPGGVHPPQHKEAALELRVGQVRLPRRLILPLHQHIGQSAEPVVEAGQEVLKGQLIAKASGYVSVAVHASSSGRVVAVEEHPVPHPSGLSAPCVIIETDGRERWVPPPPPVDYTRTDPSHLRNLVREAGIVGLGGAGFPSFIKLNPGRGRQVETLILNGVECEPYITCDDALMRERPREILAGAHIMRHALQARECVVAVEDNKPGAYEAMREAAAKEGDVRVVLLPTRYPQGSEKQLIQVLTGKEVPSNGLPIDVGVVVHNVGTAYAVYRAIRWGEPLVSRVVTVTGGAVRRPRNLRVPLGTPVVHLLRECGADFDRIDRLIMGGPMMGIALHTWDVPVVKTTNCIIAATAEEMPPPEPPMPCIRCGACMDVCPVGLLPQQLYWYAQARDLERVQAYNLFDCIECGCCAYVCPSRIPLVQYYRFAKGAIWAQERERQKADLARRRHQARQERLEREKRERAERLRQKKAQAARAPQEAVRQALERAQARREEARRRAQEQARERAGLARERAGAPPPPPSSGDREG